MTGQYAAALVLGRHYMHVLINNVRDRTVAGMLDLHLLAGAPVFQKKHGRAAVSAFCGRGCALVFGGHRERMLAEAEELVPPP